MSWQKLGAVSLDELRAARLVTHWAAQIPGGVGSSRVPARDDFSHTNVGWSGEHDALLSQPMGDVYAGFAPATLELLVVDRSATERFALAGKTIADGLAWMQTQLDERLGDSVVLSLPDHSMPAHPIGDGAAFEAPNEACAEVARWFANIDELVRPIEAAEAERASPTRVWPHHFDIATLITIEANTRTVGVGMSPGDGTFADPYLYVSTWPYPTGDLPNLPAGHWHTEGWTGAVLGAEELIGSADQGAVAKAFFEEATAHAIRLVSP